MYRILTTCWLPASFYAQCPPTVSWYIFPEKRPITRQELEAQLATQSFDAIICTYRDEIDQDLLEIADPRLRIISTLSTGTNHIDKQACAKAGIKVYNVPNLTTDAVADYMMGLILMGTRGLDKQLEQTATNSPWYYMWNLEGSALSQLSVGIIGMGNIGTALTKRLVAFGATIYYYSPNRKVAIEQQYDITYCSMESLLPKVDIIIPCCALNPSTTHLFSVKEFALMKDTAMFINVARGGICDQAALTQALEQQQISRAILDVTSPEPLPMSHKLRKLDNCIIFQHIATNTKNSRKDIFEVALQKTLDALVSSSQIEDFDHVVSVDY